MIVAQPSESTFRWAKAHRQREGALSRREGDRQREQLLLITQALAGSQREDAISLDDGRQHNHHDGGSRNLPWLQVHAARAPLYSCLFL